MDFKFPSSLKITHKSIGSIISVSSIVGIILSLFSYFNFDKIDLAYKIIIILSIFLFISVVDIVVLYVRDREQIYKLSMLDFIYSNYTVHFEENIKHMESKFLNLKEEIENIQKDINRNN